MATHFLLSEENEFDTPKKDAYSELAPPKTRPMNNDDRDDFVAIDFETMTGLRTSACALGMVKVIDGEIVQQFYTLINPIRDKYTDKEPNRSIHGISLESTEKAQTFAELFEGVRLFIGELPIVCHSKGADICILTRLMEYYGLSGIDTENVIDTYQITKKSLSKCCDDYGIPKNKHHNALFDAEACARIYLETIGKPILSRGGLSVRVFTDKNEVKGRSISKEHRRKLDECQITNKDTVFYGAKIVITGTFEKFPVRDELASALQKLGADIVSSISKKTTHVVMGHGAGPKKIDKINELRAAGYSIGIIREFELVKILQSITE